MSLKIRLKAEARVNGGNCCVGTVTRVADRHALTLMAMGDAEPADDAAANAFKKHNPKLAKKRAAKKAAADKRNPPTEKAPPEAPKAKGKGKGGGK